MILNFRPIMKPKFCMYYIDIVGTCNLRCPSCPNGNYQVSDFTGIRRPKGFMQVSLFEKILAKIKQENSDYEHVVIAVYNWGEPLIHPEFPRFIAAIRAQGFYSDVSTNLNIRDVKSVVEASPDKLIVSLSGYSPAVYSQTHKRGDSHLVVANLYMLRYYMERLHKNFPVELSYHLYRHNVGYDIERIMSIANELGFWFCSDHTYLMPLEKNLAYFDGTLSSQQQAIVALMLIKPEEQLELANLHTLTNCVLWERPTINFDGSVALCCAAYDYQHNIAPNFLEVSHSELEARKRIHKLCKICMDKGLYKIVAGIGRAEIDALIDKRLAELGSSIRRNVSHLRRDSFDY